MISYIHVMDARLGKFIYPSKDENKTGSLWTIKPFANETAKIGTKAFYIPQKVKDYSEFRELIKESENKIATDL